MSDDSDTIIVEQVGTRGPPGPGVGSSTPPPSPTTNLLWYDSSTELLKRWTGTAWKADGSAAYVAKINPSGDTTGVADPAAITAALAAFAGGKGHVQLAEGDWYFASTVALATYNAVQGAGFGTVIHRANNAGGFPLFALATNTTEQTYLGKITIDGNAANNATNASPEITYDNSGGTGFPFLHSDAFHRLEDIFIYNPQNVGVYLEGSSLVGCRVAHLSNVVVYTSKGAGGFVITSSDVKLENCTAQNCYGPGFTIGPFAAASQLVNCKSAGSGVNGGYAANGLNGIGFLVYSGRVQLTGCQGQNNGSVGFSLRNTDILCVGCLADTNGISTTAGAGSGIGFDITSDYVTLSGCHANDTGSGTSRWQAYGYQIESTVNYSRVQGTANNNITAPANNLSSSPNIGVDVSWPLSGYQETTTVYNANATVTAPLWATALDVIAVGDGGGGGGAGSATTSGGVATQTGGGGGGSGTSVQQGGVAVTGGTTTATITIGPGGTGGAGGAANNNPGSPGGPGTGTTVAVLSGPTVTAPGGGGANNSAGNSTAAASAGVYGTPHTVSTSYFPGCGGITSSSQGSSGGAPIGFSGPPASGGAPASTTLGGTGGAPGGGTNTGHTGTAAGGNGTPGAANTGQSGGGGGGGAPGGAGGAGGAGGSGYVVLKWRSA